MLRRRERHSLRSGIFTQATGELLPPLGHISSQVKTKPQFDHGDVAVLKSTHGLLCPGDILSYHLRNPRGKPKLSTIASLLDPSTPDKKLITLENGVILKPFVHDVKRQKMYCGGACGHLTNPLSVWMQMEQCTLFVGCTSNFIVADKDDNHINTNDGDVTDDSDTTNCVDLDGKHSMNIIYGTRI